MPIDASIYGNQKLPDPMAGIGTMLNLQGQQLNNRLMQLQTLGKTASGQAILDATNPDGSIDMQKLQQSLKSNPAGFAGAGDAVTTGLSAQGAGISNTKARVDLNTVNQQNLGASWGARLSRQPGTVSREDLIGDVIDLGAQGRITPDYEKTVIRQLQALPDDQLRSYAAGGYVQALGAAGAAGSAPGAPTAQGAPTQQTAGQFATQSLGGTSPDASTAPATGSGGPPAAGAGAGATAAPAVASPAPAPSPAPARGVQTGITPAAQAAATTAGTASAGQFSTLSTLADGVPQRRAALQQMASSAAKFAGGPLTPEITKMLTSVNQAFGTKFSVDNVASVEEFNKLANQIALTQAGQLDATDQTTRLAMGANPNQDLSSVGTQRIISMLLGNEDAIATKAKAAVDWNKSHTKDSYSDFSADFNKRFNPLVFQSEYWDATTAQGAFSKMKPAEVEKFKADYAYAVQQGWVQPPKAIK